MLWFKHVKIAFISGFILGIGVMTFMGLRPQNNTRFYDERDINDEFNNVYDNLQLRVRLLPREPGLNEMENNEIVASTATGRAYFRLSNKKWYWSITEI